MAVDRALEKLIKVNVPESWRNIDVKKREFKFGNDFVDKYKFQWHDMKVTGCLSVLLGMEDGSFPSGTAKYENVALRCKYLNG